VALYLSFAIAAKETKSLGRKDIQPLPAMQLCGTAVLLWFVLFIFIVRLYLLQVLLIAGRGAHLISWLFFINIHSLFSFVIATKETKSLGRKDIQPLPARQLCGTVVLL